MIRESVGLCVLLCVFFVHVTTAYPTLYPLIILPFEGENTLHIETDVSTPIAEGCPKNISFFYSPPNHDPNLTHCIDAWLRLIPNGIGGWSSPSGVTVTVPRDEEFSIGQVLGYYGSSPLVKRLYSMGYRLNQNLFILSYDWRINLPYQKFLPTFIETVTNSYYMNGLDPAIIWGSSYGSYLANYALQNTRPDWREQFVKQVVLTTNIGGSGNPRMAGAIAFGYDFYTGKVDPSKGPYQQNWSFFSAIAPSPAVFGSTPVILTPVKNYTAADLSLLLQERGATQQDAFLEKFFNDTVLSLGPSAPTICFTTSTFPTIQAISFTDNQMQGNFSFVTVEGDGSSPLIAESSCHRWQGDYVKEIQVPFEATAWYGFGDQGEAAINLLTSYFYF